MVVLGDLVGICVYGFDLFSGGFLAFNGLGLGGLVEVLFGLGPSDMLGNMSRIVAVDLSLSILPPRMGRESFQDFRVGFVSEGLDLGVGLVVGLWVLFEIISLVFPMGFLSISKLPPRIGRDSFHDLGGALVTLLSMGFRFSGVICLGGTGTCSGTTGFGIFVGEGGIDGLLTIISFRTAMGKACVTAGLRGDIRSSDEGTLVGTSATSGFIAISRDSAVLISLVYCRRYVVLNTNLMVDNGDLIAISLILLLGVTILCFPTLCATGGIVGCFVEGGGLV